MGDELKTIESETSRCEQMSLNFHFLLSKIDHIHRFLCPGKNATWIKRAEQAVEAAEKIANERINNNE